MNERDDDLCGTVRVSFVLPGHIVAASIAVVGDFNGWSETATPLERVDGGDWTASVELTRGRHRFRYLLDGTRWENDWRADDYVENDFGGHDSVIIVHPDGVGEAHLSGG